jgi:Tol biopolymer transport system component
VPIGGGAPARVTNDKDQDSNPAWTPDGKRIVYSSQRNGIRQICVVRMDGSPSIQLTGNDSNSNVLDVSLDGTKILYSTDRDESDLWAVKVDGGKETQLTSESGLELWPDGSPDGKTVAFQANRSLTGSTLFNSLVMAKHLGGDAADIQLAPDGFDPLWSPDGKQLAYLRFVNRTHNLWIVHSSGGDARQVTTGGVSFGGFSQLPYNRMQTQDFQWSPDSSRLIYCSQASGVANVWQVAVDGSAPVQLSSNADQGGVCFNPGWSPDGQKASWLAFDQIKKITTIWTIADGKQQQLFQSEAPLGLVGYSQDGQELIVKTISGTDTAPNNPVDVTLSAISLRDGKQRPIGQLPATYFQNIRETSARDKIAYVTRQDGSDSIRVMPPAGGPSRSVLSSSDPRVYFAAIAWSPDGKTIYYGKQASWTLFSMIDNFN